MTGERQRCAVCGVWGGPHDHERLGVGRIEFGPVNQNPQCQVWPKRWNLDELRAALEPPPLKWPTWRQWTHEPPTEPGFYWMAADRGDDDGINVHLVHVTLESDELVWFASIESGMGASAKVYRKDTTWWLPGPIPFPEPPVAEGV